MVLHTKEVLTWYALLGPIANTLMFPIEQSFLEEFKAVPIGSISNFPTSEGIENATNFSYFNSVFLPLLSLPPHVNFTLFLFIMLPEIDFRGNG